MSTNALIIQQNENDLDEVDEGFLLMIPQWMAYLAAAPLVTPRGKVTKRTFYILDEQFEGVDQELMLQTAQEYVRRSKWFPSVQELTDILAEVEAKADAAENQWAIPWQTHEILSYRKWSATWPTCPDCGERTPNLDDCPFCADMAVEALA